MKPSVCVLGLGYIGLPTASFLSSKGYRVHGVDLNPRVVETIEQGLVHIDEPDLDILVRAGIGSGKLSASSAPAEADVYIIAVPTPVRAGHEPDLSHVADAVDAILPVVKKGALVILESTSPVGTTEELVAAKLAAAGFAPGRDVFIAYCPERVLPGRILAELVDNDRIVGGIDEISTERAAAFYEDLIRGTVWKTDARTAELVKLIENASRDVSIAFANELSLICDRLGINTWQVISLANRHPRVKILNPGPGVGGHCIAVDPWFIVASAPEESRLIRTAREVNDAKPHWVIERVKAKAAKFKDPVIGCLGLAFKADVADLRESPALLIARTLRDAKIGQVLVCEPNLESSAEFDLMSLERIVAKSDILLVLVDHRQFRRLKSVDLKEKIVIDTRGIL